MRTLRRVFGGALYVVAITTGVGCASESEDSIRGVVQTGLKDAGAMVEVSLSSRVAVVLDEIPSKQRSVAAAYYMAQPTSFWVERAKRQLRHTTYRLTYRDFFYPDEGRRTLALPPESVWNIRLDATRARRLLTADGHDAVQIGYHFKSALLTDVDSPGVSEPRLKHIGGVWNEPFSLPLDPEYLYQRTGYACMDEDGYPLGTVRSENAAQLFDQDCDVETQETASCHLTQLPRMSCRDALRLRTGRVDTQLRFERVAYDRDAANGVRAGEFTQLKAPDLAVISERLANHWIEYRYVPSDSCAILEQCVGGAGWRRLLLFDASIKNVGAKPLVVGSTDADSPPRMNNMFEFSECHQHFHFRHYGDFKFGTTPGDKRAFCVESTDRYFNNELSPLVHEFSCDNQGVAPGWGDTYIAGVECNWIDITDIAIPGSATTQALTFQVNPDAFLCEGAPVSDAAGKPIYDPTSFVTEQGEPVNRPRCQFSAGYADNNLGTQSVTVPKRGGLITAGCTRQQAGPLRDCGFAEQDNRLTCSKGNDVHLSCRVASNQTDQVLRICEASDQLGAMACQFSEALANRVIAAGRATRIDFQCPNFRDATEPGGIYSTFVGPVLPTDPAAPIVCERILKP